MLFSFPRFAWAYLVIGLTLSWPFAAGGETTETGGKVERTVVVGFAQDTLANDWRLAQADELREEFARYPFIRFLVTDGGGDTAGQIKDIDDLMHQGVDVLIASPRDEQAMTPVLERAYRQGIPVVLITRKIASENYTSFIAPDDEAIAREAARYMARALGGKGRVLVLQGVPTASTTVARNAGFVDEVRHYNGIRISALKTGNYLRSDAIRAVEEALSEGMEFDAIYAHSDSMASGARLVLERAGIRPESLVIVGIDYIREAREAIRQGKQSASFTYPTCAKETADTVMRIIRGQTVPKRQVIPSVRVTADNVEKNKPIF